MENANNNQLILQLPGDENFICNDTKGSIFFVGTATVILRFAGFTILTDPNFLHAGDHVHLGYGITSKRITEPAIDIENLPPIDFCILSHYHGDHFDQLVEEKLRKDLPIITTKHAANELKEKNFTRTIALDTWDTTNIRKGKMTIKLTALPGKHGPAIVHYALPPVMGSMLDFTIDNNNKQLLRLYISGDTLVYDDLKEIPKRFPEIDIGLFHLGGTRILGILVTMDDEQGIEAVKLINPETVIPIHYNDYDVFKSSLEDFKRAAEKAGISQKIVYLNHGDTYHFDVAGK